MDFRINADGTLYLQTGDVELLGDDGYIGQTIYSCLMKISSDDFSKRVTSSSYNVLSAYIKAYLESELSNDPVIDSQLISVSVSSSQSGVASVSISYDGTSLENITGYSSPKFSMVAGASPLIDKNPNWLYLSDFDTSLSIPIELVVTIQSTTSRIELPRLPVCLQDNLTINSSFETSLITATKQSFVGVGSYRSINSVVISVNSSQLTYPLSRYVKDLRIGAENISSAVITNVPSTITSSSIVMKDGELCLIAIGTGEVICNLVVSPIGYVSNNVIIEDDKEKDRCLYKLKPVRGKIFALFPKTLKPDTYVISYNAYNERSNS